jgi:hypothetical protein
MQVGRLQDVLHVAVMLGLRHDLPGEVPWMICNLGWFKSSLQATIDDLLCYCSCGLSGKPKWKKLLGSRAESEHSNNAWPPIQLVCYQLGFRWGYCYCAGCGLPCLARGGSLGWRLASTTSRLPPSCECGEFTVLQPQ